MAVNEPGPVLHLDDDTLRRAQQIDLTAARNARTDAVWLLRQATALCLAAAESYQAAVATLQRAARAADDAALDDLTGAYRRHPGFTALGHEVERARRERTALVVGFLDVDGLKRVNDNRGHDAGDALLTAVVTSLRASLRSYDVVVRYGGDEFVFSIGDADLAAAEKRLRTMRVLLGERMPGHSVSAGFAELREDDDLLSLVRRADDDLYARRAAVRGPGT